MSNPKESLRLSESLEALTFWDINSFTQLDTEIVEGIVECVAASGLTTTDEDTLNHIQGDLISVHKDKLTNRVVAFSSTLFGSPNDIFQSQDLSDTSGCYLAGATVAADQQGKGIYKYMNEQRVGVAIDQQLPMIYTRTQNPRVQAGIQSVLNGLTESGSIQGYTVERVLMKGCYGHQLTATKPFDDEISFEELDYDNGDAYVLMFNLSY